MKEREKNYDFLRTISCVMVVALHWGCFLCGKNYQSDAYAYMLGYFLQSISRFAVPCFIMLSGAFVLCSKKTENVILFWKKGIPRLVVPTMFFSLIYVMFSYARLLAGNTERQSSLWTPLLNWLKGEPYWHMWYVYMLFGLYFIAPFIAMMRNQIKQYIYLLLIVIMLLVGIVLEYTCNLIWCFQFIQYSGYFMLGDYIRRYHKANSRVERFKRWVLFFSIGILGIIFILSYNLKDDYTFYQPMSPLVIFASVGIFWWFSNIKVEIDTSWFSEKSLYIYLLHVGIMDCMNIVVTKMMGYPISIVYFPIGFLVTVLFSLTGAQLIGLVQVKIKTYKMKNIE